MGVKSPWTVVVTVEARQTNRRDAARKKTSHSVGSEETLPETAISQFLHRYHSFSHILLLFSLPVSLPLPETRSLAEWRLSDAGSLCVCAH